MEQQDLQQKYRKRLDRFCLMDDTFMRKALGNEECVREILRITVGLTDIREITVTTQKSITNLHGHSVSLDVHARDGNGKTYDIEIQNESAGAIPKRARYYASILDANQLEAGADYAKLPETYVIFITQNDVLDAGLPIYFIDLEVKDADGKEYGLFRDEQHIVYVNGANRDESTELGKMVHDFWCRSAENMYNRIFADRVRFYKEDKKGVDEMCKIMEELRAEGKEEGLEEGIRVFIKLCREFHQTKQEILHKLLENFQVTDEDAGVYLRKYW